MESPRESPDVPMISMKEVNKHFGDLHVHTRYSQDANWRMGTTLTGRSAQAIDSPYPN